MSKIDYKKIKEEFKKNEAWGLHTIIDLKGCNQKTIRSPKLIEEFVIKLCEIIDMKRFGNPQIIHFGEDEKVSGYSLTQLIETSLISGHFANASNAAYLDVFSCKLYDPNKVVEFCIEFFGAKSHNVKIIHRI